MNTSLEGADTNVTRAWSQVTMQNVGSQTFLDRPSCLLPYELCAEGGLNAGGTAFELQLKAGNEVYGGRAVGSPFNVYLRNMHGAASGADGMTVGTYAVKAGDALSQGFPLSLFAHNGYSIGLHGPNGFYRSFSGDSNAPTLQVRIANEWHGVLLASDVQVRLSNSGRQPLKGCHAG